MSKRWVWILGIGLVLVVVWYLWFRKPAPASTNGTTPDLGTSIKNLFG